MAWNFSCKALICAAALFAAATTGPAQGTSVLEQKQDQQGTSVQQQGQDQQGANVQQQSQEQSTTAPGEQGEEPATLSELQGKIVREKEVSVYGSDVKSKLVLLELDNGQRLAVDLGPVTALKAEILKEGESVTVHGGMVKCGEETVFLAHQLDAGGQSFKIERPLAQDLTGGGGQSRQFQMSGVVENTQNVDVRGGGGQNVVALLHNDKDKRVLVDLGPVSGLQEMQLKKGDRVAVTGHSVRIGDRAILFAESVSMNNKTVQVTRPEYHEEQEDQGSQSEQGGQEGQMGQQGQQGQE